MFRSISNFLGWGSSGNNGNSFSDVAEDMITSATESIMGTSEPQGPRSVIIVYGKHEVPLEFTEIDFDAEENPKNGITVENLKWAISRVLTPYILGDSKKPVSQTQGAMSRPSSTLNANKLSVTFKGKKLDNPKKTLKSYGIKTNDKLIAGFDSNTASTAAAAAAADRARQTRGKPKKGGKKKGGSGGPKKPAQNASGPGNQREITNMNSIPKNFPKKPLTAREKIAKVLEEVEKDIVPLINKFVANVPEDKQQREDDHRIISESLLQKMLMLDGVDTAEEEEGEHELTLRQTRKNAVNIMHQHMSRADEASKAQVEKEESKA